MTHSNRNEKKGFNELELVLFLRDLFHDSAEQTNALKQLAESYSKLVRDIFTSKDADDNHRTIENALGENKAILTALSNQSSSLIQKIDNLVSVTGEMGSKSKGYMEVMREMVETEKNKVNFSNKMAERELEHQQAMDKIKQESDAKIRQIMTTGKLKLVLQIVGYILGSGGIIALILSFAR